IESNISIFRTTRRSQPMATADTTMTEADPHKRKFDEYKASLGADLDRSITAVDAGTSPQILTKVQDAIDAAGKRVAAEAIHWMTARLTAACANVHSSMNRLCELAADIIEAKKKLASLPAANWVHGLFSFLYGFAALVVVGTEVKLMDAFAALL